MEQFEEHKVSFKRAQEKRTYTKTEQEAVFKANLKTFLFKRAFDL